MQLKKKKSRIKPSNVSIKRSGTTNNQPRHVTMTKNMLRQKTSKKSIKKQSDIHGQRIHSEKSLLLFFYGGQTRKHLQNATIVNILFLKLVLWHVIAIILQKLFLKTVSLNQETWTKNLSIFLLLIHWIIPASISLYGNSLGYRKTSTQANQKSTIILAIRIAINHFCLLLVTIKFN